MKLHRGSDLKFVILLILFLSSTIGSATFAQSSYDIGSPTLTDIWVDPVLGSDSNTGDTRDQALLTVRAAWGKVPQGVLLTGTGYRIKLVAGDYPESSFPTYWESRYGTYQFPVILEAADTPLSSRIHAYLNFYDVRYLYLVGLSFVTDAGYGGGGNVVHVEQGDHFLIRGCKLNGNDGAMNQPQETLKVNQSQYFYVEDSDIGGAFWFALDFVSVVYGHVVGNRIHDADNDCVVLKGGVAYLRIEGNEVDHCGVIGLGAGQGTGFNWMVSPWLHYEAYDLKFINNVVHHVANAGLAVRGGYDILFAYNTLYRVGTAENDSALFLASPGARGCDGDTAACQSRHAAGGWGPPSNGDGGEWIPNRNVFVYNNVFYNPAPYRTQSAHLGVFGPVNPPADTNIPSPSYSDTNLQIRGNVIWNGPTDLPLGIEESDQGCQPTNLTCNSTQLHTDNTINTLEPQLINPENGNFRPIVGGNVFRATSYSIPDFTWSDAPATPGVPQGTLSNSVPIDRDGHPRTGSGPPGAYSLATPSSTRCDFNGDGKTDILWRNRSTGQNVVWLMNGAAFSSYSLIDAVADTNWQIVGTGDFNGDGKTDILWRSKNTGQNVVWLMNGTALSSYVWIDTVADTNWEIVGTGDFNGDGKTDILWRSKSTGQNVVWLMNGAALSSYVWIDTVADTNWEIVGTGDFNGDGKTDILWRNKSTGQNVVWLMNGTALSSYSWIDTVADTNWEIVGTGDFNGDGKTDILWWNKSTGQNVVWLMNGIALSSYSWIDTVADTNWEIVGPK